MPDAQRPTVDRRLRQPTNHLQAPLPALRRFPAADTPTLVLALLPPPQRFVTAVVAAVALVRRRRPSLTVWPRTARCPARAAPPYLILSYLILMSELYLKRCNASRLLATSVPTLFVFRPAFAVRRQERGHGDVAHRALQSHAHHCGRDNRPPPLAGETLARAHGAGAALRREEIGSPTQPWSWAASSTM